MRYGRRRVLLAAPALLAGRAALGFPDRPLTMVVPYGAGGNNDVLGRAIAGEMQTMLGQQVVVENRPGAGGNIGAAQVAQQARPDGHTILFHATSLAANLSLMRLPFNPLRDLVPLAGVGAIPSVVVVPPTSAFRALPELLAAARARPATLTYGSSGPGTGTHLGTELLAAAAGVSLVHVPYRGGSAQIYTDLLAGRLDVMLDILGAGAARIEQGQARALAVTSAARVGGLPDVPTVAEQGLPGFAFATWFGFFAPAAVPPTVLSHLEAALLDAMATPAVRARLMQANAEPIPAPAAAFGTYFRQDVERWAALVQAGRLQRLD